MAGASPSDTPIKILLVEDNLADIRLLQETLKGSYFATQVHAARDGVEALAYLHHSPPFNEVPRPDVILLDLSLPRMDGREVLAHVRGTPGLNGIPVVIFTSSPADEDVRLAFNFRAEGYVRKPLGLKEFHDLVVRLGLSR
jgi:two-component system, chemotaxis family, response regulator Rcp1